MFLKEFCVQLESKNDYKELNDAPTAYRTVSAPNRANAGSVALREIEKELGRRSDYIVLDVTECEEEY